jgi:hypothetical protein
LLEEIVELMDNTWPDEHYLRNNFDEEMEFDDMADKDDVHKDTKVSIAETIFELLRAACSGNIVNKEYVFFELVPMIQKYVSPYAINLSVFIQFGVGFRKDQDFELFKELVEDCDKYADYKEKSKYNIIF